MTFYIYYWWWNIWRISTFLFLSSVFLATSWGSTYGFLLIWESYQS